MEIRRRPKKDCSMKIETRALAALIPYINNARTHSDAQVAQIAASIREFGWTNPVLVDGENGVIAGHGRLMAARKLGMESVPVIELAHMTPAQKRAYTIADNKLTLNGGWDDGLLLVELGELGDAGFDLELTGFTLDEINDLMAGDEPPGDVVSDAQPEDDAPSLVEVGDVWILGRHRLMCGDSSSVTDIDALLGGREPDLLIYDPPYEVEAAWTWQYLPRRRWCFPTTSTCLRRCALQVPGRMFISSFGITARAGTRRIARWLGTKPRCSALKRLAGTSMRRSIRMAKNGRPKRSAIPAAIQTTFR